MRDVFYTILIVWIIWKIIGAYNAYTTSKKNFNNNGARYQRNNNKEKEGETFVKYQPPTHKKISDDEGEYVDFEDVE